MPNFLITYMDAILRIYHENEYRLEPDCIQDCDIHELRGMKGGFERALLHLHKWHAKVLEQQPEEISKDIIIGVESSVVEMIAGISRIECELKRRGESV